MGQGLSRFGGLRVVNWCAMQSDMAELLFRDPREYLRFEHELRRARRPAYSMRAFARDLEVSPSGLNDFLKGRVGMSPGRVEKIAQILRWSPTRKEHFLDLIYSKHGQDPAVRQASQMRIKARLKEGSSGLDLDAFKAISEWHHLVIRELCELKDNLQIKEIAHELEISPQLAAKAVKRLLRLKLLKETSKGFKPTEANCHFGDEIPSEAIREFHSQILDLAQRALKEKSMNERESHSLIFSIRKEDLSSLRSDLKKAILQIANKYAHSENRSAIQALSLQVFPVWTE
jgi:uncharacterized protein (TIGR02147 family)